MHKILWGIGKFRFEIKGKHKKDDVDYSFSIWIGPFWMLYSVVFPILPPKHKSGTKLYGIKNGEIFKKVVD